MESWHPKAAMCTLLTLVPGSCSMWGLLMMAPPSCIIPSLQCLPHLFNQANLIQVNSQLPRYWWILGFTILDYDVLYLSVCFFFFLIKLYVHVPTTLYYKHTEYGNPVLKIFMWTKCMVQNYRVNGILFVMSKANWHFDWLKLTLHIRIHKINAQRLMNKPRAAFKPDGWLWPFFDYINLLYKKNFV